MLFLKPFREDMINNSLFLGKESDDAISFGMLFSETEFNTAFNLLADQLLLETISNKKNKTLDIYNSWTSIIKSHIEYAKNDS